MTETFHIHVDEEDTGAVEELTRVISSEPQILAIDEIYTTRSGNRYRVTRIDIRKPNASRNDQ